jgi:cobalt-zinc-cadmium efflux system membrane fusion protein
MNRFIEKLQNRFKENKTIASIAVVLLAGVILAFALWPAGSGEASPEGEHAGEAHAEGDHAEEGGQEDEGRHEEGDAREVHLTADQRSRLSVQTSTLQSGSAASGLRRPAALRFNPDQVARIGPRVDAKVSRVLVDLGDRVRRGQGVAVMNSMKLGEAKSDYLTAQARLGTARATYEREQKLREEGISSEAELLQARSAFQEVKSKAQAAAETLRLYGLSNSEIQNIDSGSGRAASQFVLRSPISGRVEARELSPGQSVSQSETPIHVADASTMWAMIDAYERDLPALREGQNVVLNVRGLGQRFRGKIDFISAQLDEESRTVKARAVIQNENHQLRAGMFGTAEIEAGADSTGAATQYAMIPTDAVQQVNGESVVFVPGEEEGAFRVQHVQTGAETEDGMVTITSGLQPGDVAVTQGAFDLKSALTASGRSASHGH